MSDKQFTLFPKDTDTPFPAEENLLKILLEKGVIEVDERGFYHLSVVHKKILDPKSELSKDCLIAVWLEYFDDFKIQVGVNVEDIQSVTTPDTGKHIGGLDFAYEMLKNLHENHDAVWVDSDTGNEYKVRDLEYDKLVAYGKSFIQFDAYFDPPQAFIQKFEDILGVDLRYGLYWL